MVVFTHATWNVAPGREEEFIAAWKAMGPVFQATCDEPLHGTLLRRMDDPSHFVSFGPWPDKAAVQRMREDPAAGVALTNIIALCTSAEPGTYEVAAES